MTTSPGRNPVRAMLDEGRGTAPRRRFQLLGEIVSELGKVTWPSRQDAIRLTVLVIGISLVMGIFLGLWDLGFSNAIESLLGIFGG